MRSVDTVFLAAVKDLSIVGSLPNFFDDEEQLMDFKAIYATQAEAYEAMIAREDYQGNLLPALERIRPFHSWRKEIGRMLDEMKRFPGKGCAADALLFW